MARFFNTAGPNRLEWHYTLPTLDRLPEVRRLVEARAWFVLHAPRQSGKTTTMRALAQELATSGQYAALHASCEAGATWRDDPNAAARAVIGDIRRNASQSLPTELQPPEGELSLTDPALLASYVSAWCQTCPRPVVLLLDEIDALQDDALVSVLRQLRSMYPNRPQFAPSTVALVGLRDVRDYKVASGGSPHLGTASPFNVKVASLTLGNFSRDDVAALYGQHTSETGQAFTAQAIDRAFAYTCGQPWLVNALAWQVVEQMQVRGTVEASHIDRAKELLILSRSTHLDSLADKLNEPRVRAVIAPILTGHQLPLDVPARDIDYCEDLGLITGGSGAPRIANPIYREVLPRELAHQTGRRIELPERRWALPDGRLDFAGLLAAFVDFWRQHGEWLVRGQQWPEAAHQIVLMAFLQRIVNGGGYLEREYGLGTLRLDLLIRWFVGIDAYGCPLAEDRHAIEVKVWRDDQKDPVPKGLEQLDAYLARLGLATGTLFVFDARSGAPVGEDWERRGDMGEARTPGGRLVGVLRV